eukprot:GFYU01005885.1.p1 GENE.GFYU01005885.1~~GFYU01005885.1.p1  ORF type:complete len:548 (-),score=181.41 GFYU01005885.1:346-1989(-)
MKTLLLVLGCLALCTMSVEANLYSGNSNILSLWADQVKEKVDNSRTAWLIEFYASWCPHCQRFSSTFKNVASSLRSWPSVNVGAVDCADTSNADICDEYGIMGFPTVYFFNDHSSAYSYTQYYGSLYQSSIIDWVQGNLSSRVRRLETVRDADEFFVKDETYPKVVIVEDEDAMMTLSTSSEDTHLTHIKDMERSALEMDGRVPFARISVQQALDSEFMAVASTLGVQADEAPVTVFTKLSFNGEWQPMEQGVSRDLLNSILERSLQERTPAGVASDLIGQPETEQVDLSKADVSDIKSALIFSLRHEVSRGLAAVEHGHSKFSQENILSALHTFLTAVSKSFPGAENRESISQLNAWVQEKIDSGEKVGFRDYKQHLSTLKIGDTEIADSNVHWKQCVGSHPYMRGYTCGLWTLFHTTVTRADVTSGNTALVAVKTYIEHFFSCTDCAEHFMMSASAIPSVHTQEEATLWLWNKHNSVNNRLKDDITEDPAHPKVQFPPYEFCPACRRVDEETGEITWDKAEVLKFLYSRYGFGKPRPLYRRSNRQ